MRSKTPAAKIGVIGIGAVGSAVVEGFKSRGYTVITYDKSTDKELPEEFKEVVFGILNKSFQMGISPQGINKVLRRLKMDLIPLRRKSNASGLKKS